MSNKTKIILGIAAFALVLTVAVVGYNQLTKIAAQKDVDSSQSSKTAAIDFTVQDKNGKNVSLSDYKGKPVVLNFWASWCPPCKAEMPDYESMYKQYSQQGVAFMMVDLTDGQRETADLAKQFLEDNKYTFPAYFDIGTKAANAYGVSSIPTSLFIDKEGNIVSRHTGMMDAAAMKKNIEGILE